LAKPLISQWDGYSNGARIDDNVEYLDDDTKLVSENGAITHWSGVLVGFVSCGAEALACLVLVNFAAASPRGKIEVADL
jgi:hypothetical protein